MTRRLLGIACLLATAAGAADLPKLGVAGELRMGLGGVLVRAGLPFDYLTATEECDAQALAKYDVILAAALEDNDDFGPAALQAFDAYVRGGGHLYAELGWRLPGALGPVQTEWRGEARQDLHFALVPGTHPLLAELPGEHNWLYKATLLRVRADDPSVTVLARFTGGRRGGSPALLARKYGQGEVVFTPTEIGYRQGNWEPLYEDLFLAIIAYLSGGRARAQWLSPPAPTLPLNPPAAEAPTAATPEPGYPPLAQATDLGAATPDGYCLRVPLTAEHAAQVILEYQPTPRAGLVLDATARHAELTPLLPGRTGRPLRVDLPAGATELLVARLPRRVDLLVDGTRLGSLPVPLRSGLGCFARVCEPLLQPTEPVWFSDDFTGEGALSEVWRRVDGDWSLSGQTPAIARVPGFALRATAGTIAAGRWFWSQYRAQVSVRALAATQIILQVARWDAANHLDLRCPVGTGALSLVRVRGGQETVLASGGQALPARQWLRLGLTLADGRATATVDGEPVLDAATDAALGGLGLAVTGGEAVFDDVRVGEAHEQPVLPRVHPVEYDKGPGGLLDRDTWASPAAAWVPQRQPRTMWHVGRFADDFTLSVPLHNPGPAASLTLHAGHDRGVPAPVLTVTGPAACVELRRRAGVLSASVDGRPTAVTAQPTGSLCLGLQWQDLALVAAELELSAAGVREYLFDKAPVDWQEAGGEWTITSRWTCNPQWSWLAGRDDNRMSALWLKRPVRGDVVVQAPQGPLMHGNYGPGCEDFARLRLTLCGDGRDPWSGYTFELGQAGQDVCTLYRQHQPVASIKDRLPRWREIHNAWFDVRFERVGNALDVTYHGRPLLHWVDPAPLGDGRVCLWTESNGVVTPYLAVYGQQ